MVNMTVAAMSKMESQAATMVKAESDSSMANATAAVKRHHQQSNRSSTSKQKGSLLIDGVARQINLLCNGGRGVGISCCDGSKNNETKQEF